MMKQQEIRWLYHIRPFTISSTHRTYNDYEPTWEFESEDDVWPDASGSSLYRFKYKELCQWFKLGRG